MRSIRISDAEWQVMEILWQTNALSAQAILKALEPTRRWHLRTIRTLLDRLIEKGAVQLDSTRRPFFYSPLLNREACVRAASESIIDRAFQGEPASLILHLVQNTKLKKAEIHRLKKLLDEM